MHCGDLEAVGERHRLREDLGAADHHDLVGSAPQRVAAGGVERGVETAAQRSRPARRSVGSRLTTMLVRPGSGLPIER